MTTHSSVLAWEIPWQRSLAGYSPWGHKELGTTEQLNNNKSSEIGSDSSLHSFKSSLREVGKTSSLGLKYTHYYT